MALATNNFMTFYQFSISFLLLPNGKVSQEENLLREGVILNLHLCLPSKMYLFQAHTYTGKTRARRAGGRYRPHTVHGLGLDHTEVSR